MFVESQVYCELCIWQPNSCHDTLISYYCRINSNYQTFKVENYF